MGDFGKPAWMYSTGGGESTTEFAAQPNNWRYYNCDDCNKGYNKCYYDGQCPPDTWTAASFDNYNHHESTTTGGGAMNGGGNMPPASTTEHVINLYDLYSSDRPDPYTESFREPIYQPEDAYYCCNQTTGWNEQPDRSWNPEPQPPPGYFTQSSQLIRPVESDFGPQPSYWNRLPLPVISRCESERCSLYKPPNNQLASPTFPSPCLPFNKNFNQNASHSSMSVNLEMNMTIPKINSKKQSVSSIQMQSRSTKYKVTEHITIKQHNITDVYRVQRKNFNKSKTLCSQYKHIEINQFDSVDQPNYPISPQVFSDEDCNGRNVGKANLCIICGKNYARPSTLKTHLRTHSGEKPYRCNICDKAFSQAANLTAHIRTHSGEKPFPCPICQRRFSQSSSVTTHLRTHSGERPYCCDFCHKAFSDSSTLTKHLRIHSGEKPYQCRMCLLRFSQSGNLNRHMRIHMST